MAAEREPLAERMMRAARELQDEADASGTYDAAVRLAAENVRGCDAAAVSLVRRRGRLETTAATDPFAAECDALQYHLGEGPCRDAVWEERVIHSPDLEAEARWSTWGPQVAEEYGVRSMLCLRLFTGRDTVGALNLYSRTPGAFDADDRDDALAVAAHISVAVAGAQRIDALTGGMDARTVIGQATGVAMERYDLSPDRAFALLSRLASETNTRVRDLAVEVVADHARLDGSGASDR